jgi:hypothetical protein
MPAIKVPDAPYQAYPTADMGGRLPALHVDTPEAAFGANVAEAVRHLGGTIGNVGDELVSRGLEIQKMKNDAEANELVNDTVSQGFDKIEGYKTQFGKNAIGDNYTNFRTDLENFYQQQRAKASNPAVARSFDSAARSSFRQIQSQAAGHAATEEKRYSVGTSDANIEQAQQDLGRSDLSDPSVLDSKIAAIKKGVDEKVATLGLGKAQGEVLFNKERSKGLYHAVENLSRTNQINAKAFLEANKANMLGDDLRKATDVVNNEMSRFTARSVANATMGGWPARTTQAEMDNASGIQPAIVNVFKHAARAIEDEGDPNFNLSLRGGPVSGSDFLINSAINVAALDKDGKVIDTPEAHAKVERAMEAAFNELGIPMGPERENVKENDPYHYSLPKDYDASKAPAEEEQPLSRMYTRAGRYADSINSDDPRFKDTVLSRLGIDYNERQRVKRDEQNKASEDISEAMAGMLANGQRPKNKDELLLTPALKAAWDALPKSRQRIWEDSMLKLRTEVDDQTEKRKYIGMTPEELSAVPPEEIMGNDKLTLRTQNALLARRKGYRTNPTTGNPMVNKAIGILGSMVPREVFEDKDRRLDFRGGMEIMLDDEIKANNGKFPSNEEVKRIGASLLYRQVTKGLFWGFNESDPAFEWMPTEKQIKDTQILPVWGGRIASRDEATDALRHQHFQELNEQRKQAGLPTLPPGAEPRSVARPAIPAPVAPAQAPARTAGPAPAPEVAAQTAAEPAKAPAEAPAEAPATVEPFRGGVRTRVSEEQIAASQKEIAEQEAAKEVARATARRAATGRFIIGKGEPAPSRGAQIAETKAIQAAESQQRAEQARKNQIAQLDREEEYAKTRIRPALRERELARIKRERAKLKGTE